MKLSLANSVRSRYIHAVMAFLAEQGEDVALIASNACNLPIVEDGEEGVLEVVVKVVKKEYDECMQEREDYVSKCAEQARKAADREKVAAEKKARAEAKAAEKATKAAEAQA